MFALSTASVYPDDVSRGFDYAARLGYDAVEVMVSIDSLSQSPRQVKKLSEYYEMPVCAVHAPCLLITQRVWGTDPWIKLERSAEMARDLGADVVVVHPPFRWQREYAEAFVNGIADLERRTGIAFAVENMYPWRATGRDLQMYAPNWDPTADGYRNMTLDVSHASTARMDSLELAKRMDASLRHLHLTDGLGSPRDEHLIPGRGSQPVAELLNHLRDTEFGGHVVVEINTRKAGSKAAREQDLLEALAFAQLHMG
ncbi:MAG TPA: sugar phosphate isomerase/epimerase family protein [Marmoricola sp.]|nr:sugar phosphate isomerase/epimerase family protein [Marmoricola sp.]